MIRLLALLLPFWLLPGLLLPGLLLPVWAAAAELPPLAGRWDVTYRDAELGTVTGTARVAEDERNVVVTYKHPLTGRAHETRGTIERAASRLIVRLSGDMVSADVALPRREKDVALTAPGELTLGEGDAATTVAVAPAPPAGAFELILEATTTSDVLSGRWSQRVSAATGQVPGGGGRAGAFRLLYDGVGGAVMEGLEQWQRPVTKLVTALPLADQFLMALGEPDYPEPFDASGRLTKPIADRRLIAVLGEGLPLEYGDAAVLESLDPGIEYSVHALAWDFARPGMDPWPLERAWQMLAREFGEARLPALRQFDIVILEARLKPGVLPGPKTFRLNGAEAAWMLQYGDWKGELSIARDLGFGEAEPADYVVPGETIYLQVRLDRAVAAAEIPVLLAVAGADGKALRPVLVDGEREIVLARSADDPRVYRSRPLRLAEPEYLDAFPPGSGAVGVIRGEKLIATLAGDPIFELRPRMAAAVVLQSPRHLKAHLLDDPRARSRTWDEALRAAARCVGAEAPDGVALSDAESETFANRILTSASTGLWGDEPGWWVTLATKVKIGEHAAAILLRDVFVDLLEQKVRALSLSLDDDGLRGFRELVGSDLYGAYAALASVEVRGPNGGTIAFGATFSDALMRDTYGLAGEALEDYRLIATIDARTAYMRATQQARQTAAEIDDCDLDKLLMLTGFDFAPVRRVARQLALTLGPEESGGEGPRWVADRRARAWIDRVELVAQSLAEQRAIARMDNSILLTASAIATLPLALSESAAALAAMAILDGADLLYTGYELVSTVREVDAETAFAVGASVLLGNRRYRAAEARAYEWVPQFFATVAAGAGTAFSGIDLYEGLATRSHRAAVREGNEAIARLTGGSADAADIPRLQEVSPEEATAILEAMIAARRIEQQLGAQALEPTEKLALDLSHTLEQAAEAVPARPVWAQHLSDELFRKLGPRAESGNVIALFARQPERMAELVAMPDGMDLLWLPWRSVDEYAAAVTRRANRRPPQGEAFYYQMSPRAADPEGIYVEGGFIPDRGSNLYGTVRYLAYPGSETQRGVGLVHSLHRPDDFFGTDASMLVLHIAQSERMWLKGFALPLDEARGVPLSLYLNLRSMLDFGFTYADRSLKVVKYSNILNLDTCLQLHWLRKTYPKARHEELFRATDLYAYGRGFLEQAGLRVDEVSFDYSAKLIERTPAQLKEEGWFDGSDFDALLARYGVDKDEFIATGYDVYLRVSPVE